MLSEFEFSLSLLTKVVEQIFFEIIIEGYIDLKSNTVIHGRIPASTSCTYPPAIWFFLRGPDLVIGTAIFERSANLITRESIHQLVVAVAAISNVVIATDARASFRPIDCNLFSISMGIIVSLTQYFITSSGLSAHSLSIWLESISNLCIPSSSGHNN